MLADGGCLQALLVQTPLLDQVDDRNLVRLFAAGLVRRSVATAPPRQRTPIERRPSRAAAVLRARARSYTANTVGGGCVAVALLSCWYFVTCCFSYSAAGRPPCGRACGGIVPTGGTVCDLMGRCGTCLAARACNGHLSVAGRAGLLHGGRTDLPWHDVANAEEVPQGVHARPVVRVEVQVVLARVAKPEGVPVRACERASVPPLPSSLFTQSHLLRRYPFRLWESVEDP